VRTLLNRFYIVRTAWLYARGGNNFVTKIIAAADKHGALRVVTDEVSAPTYAPDLAGAIARLIHTDHFGIFHFANSGICSRYDWACKILQLSGRGHIPVEPITTEQWPRAAPPPLYAPILNFTGAALGITLRPWEEALQEYFASDEP
jgi:dTDP-4-dehydrorhamnose reductase